MAIHYLKWRQDSSKASLTAANNFLHRLKGARSYFPLFTALVLIFDGDVHQIRLHGNFVAAPGLQKGRLKFRCLSFHGSILRSKRS